MHAMHNYIQRKMAYGKMGVKNTGHRLSQDLLKIMENKTEFL